MCRHVSAPRRVSTCRHLPRCRHLLRCWHMPAHPSLQITKSIWLVPQVSALRCVGTCRHLPRCRYFFRCWHMSTHISIQIKFIWLASHVQACVCTCRHLDVSAPSQVSAPFQVLTHAITSQFANNKVHMISTTGVGTCRHVDLSARAGTCRHLPRCRYFFRCWHMSTHISIQIKFIWLASHVSARVGT